MGPMVSAIQTVDLRKIHHRKILLILRSQPSKFFPFINVKCSLSLVEILKNLFSFTQSKRNCLSRIFWLRMPSMFNQIFNLGLCCLGSCIYNSGKTAQILVRYNFSISYCTNSFISHTFTSALSFQQIKCKEISANMDSSITLKLF